MTEGANANQQPIRIVLKSDFEEQLILQIKTQDEKGEFTRRCLFDKGHPSYRNAATREREWSAIASFLGKTAKECSNLWSSLRNQHTKFRNKLSKPSGSGAGKLPFFSHEQALAFLRDTEDDPETMDNYTDTQSSQVQEEDDETEEEDENQENRTPSSSTRVPHAKPQSEERSHNNKRKRADKNFDQELLDSLKEEDEFRSYGNVVALKLEKIAGKNRKEFLKLQNEINRTIHKYEIEACDE